MHHQLSFQCLGPENKCTLTLNFSGLHIHEEAMLTSHGMESFRRASSTLGRETGERAEWQQGILKLELWNLGQVLVLTSLVMQLWASHFIHLYKIYYMGRWRERTKYFVRLFPALKTVCLLKLGTLTIILPTLPTAIQ